MSFMSILLEGIPACMIGYYMPLWTEQILGLVIEWAFIWYSVVLYMPQIYSSMVTCATLEIF